MALKYCSTSKMLNIPPATFCIEIIVEPRAPGFGSTCQRIVRMIPRSKMKKVDIMCRASTLLSRVISWVRPCLNLDGLEGGCSWLG